MSAIDREALRPAFENNWVTRYGHQKWEPWYWGAPSVQQEFIGFCAAMESLLTDEATEKRKHEEWWMKNLGHPDSPMATSQKAWLARACMNAAITGKAE